VFVGDAMEDLYTGELGLPVFLFQEGDDREATRTFREIARLTGAPIAGSIQVQPGSWASSCGRSLCMRLAGGRRFWRVAMPAP
jgi:hypothetical protein